VKLSLTQCAYLAGLLDGEGCIFIANHITPALNISNTNKSVLIWIKHIVGKGGVYKVPRTNHKHKLCWVYCIRSRAAIALLRKLYPFLLIKVIQATTLLQYPIAKVGIHTTKSEKILRTKYEAKLKKLNRRGK